MVVNWNEFESSSESTAHSREDCNASWEQYLERRNLVLQFLHSNLSLQHQRNKAELLKKRCFYMEIEPKHMTVREHNLQVRRINILELIDPIQWERMKQVGKKQTEIHLLLLTELIEQLEQGWEELSCCIETCDMKTFLSGWDGIMQRLSKLSEFMETLIPLQVPGQVYVKHHLVTHAELTYINPIIRLSLSTKMPLIFDHEESFAHKDWAKLKWFDENPESGLEQCELPIKILTNWSQAEAGYSRLQPVSSNMCIVQDLQPGRSYEFTIRRSCTHTFVFGDWHDSITLKTKTDAVEDVDSITWILEGYGGTQEHFSHFIHLKKMNDKNETLYLNILRKTELIVFSTTILQVLSPNLPRLTVTHSKFLTQNNILRQHSGLNTHFPLPELTGGSSQKQAVLQDTLDAKCGRQKHLHHAVLFIHQKTPSASFLQ